MPKLPELPPDITVEQSTPPELELLLELLLELDELELLLELDELELLLELDELEPVPPPRGHALR